ncbi:uncharacterized protein LOC131937806 [Physella acuta]|uniref:uncharacterized protein LOC131937806 n=1 Tax=Physella acuta TaxID=109671 RepID=UPI0027DB9EAB|nr:uncharacterized protein LOC131937806 [Physella acuta]
MASGSPRHVTRPTNPTTPSHEPVDPDPPTPEAESSQYEDPPTDSNYTLYYDCIEPSEANDYTTDAIVKGAWVLENEDEEEDETDKSLLVNEVKFRHFTEDKSVNVRMSPYKSSHADHGVRLVQDDASSIEKSGDGVKIDVEKSETDCACSKTSTTSLSHTPLTKKAESNFTTTKPVFADASHNFASTITVSPISGINPLHMASTMQLSAIALIATQRIERQGTLGDTVNRVFTLSPRTTGEGDESQPSGDILVCEYTLMEPKREHSAAAKETGDDVSIRIELGIEEDAQSAGGKSGGENCDGVPDALNTNTNALAESLAKIEQEERECTEYLRDERMADRIQQLMAERDDLEFKTHLLLAWNSILFFFLVSTLIYACACVCGFRKSFTCGETCLRREKQQEEQPVHKKWWE